MYYPTNIVKQFLSSEQLNKIKNLIDSYVITEIVEAPIGRYVGVSPELDVMLNELIPKLPNEVLFIKIIEATIPGGPHSDTSLPNPLPKDYVIPNFARTFIIPFETVDTNTILFNEILPTGSNHSDYINNMPLIRDTEKIISNEVYNKYLSHCSKSMCATLSIDTVFPWVAGDMLIFDRQKIHCSDNYSSCGLKIKRGFVIWSEVRDQ